MSGTVRGVREERDGSSVRSFWIRVMHFLSGMDGKSASASKDKRISSASSFIFLIFCTKSTEFLQENGECL